MAAQRPVFLNLMQMKFPPMAIVSILHRASGVLIFLLIPFLLYALQISATSPANFLVFQQVHVAWWFRLLLWVELSAVCYHVIAGFRHLFMDLGWGESLCAARASAYGVFLLSLIGIVLAGVWIW